MDPLPPLHDDDLFGALADGQAAPDPVEVLQRWIDDAVAAELLQPTAMLLATVDREGRPDARVVIVRGLDARGLQFYTNYRSPKALQLEACPDAAMVANWQPLERQARVWGPVERLPAEECDAFFASRPRGAQIGAWAFQQSEPVADHTTLHEQVAEVEARFEGQKVPRPPHWGGYLLRPDAVEFWQGRPSQVHDRLRYVRTDDAWSTHRLQP